jgi:hypothetical protein
MCAPRSSSRHSPRLAEHLNPITRRRCTCCSPVSLYALISHWLPSKTCASRLASRGKGMPTLQILHVAQSSRRPGMREMRQKKDVTCCEKRFGCPKTVAGRDTKKQPWQPKELVSRTIGQCFCRNEISITYLLQILGLPGRIRRVRGGRGGLRSPARAPRFFG